MGLIGGMARTAVVAGTATAVSNRVSRRQAGRWQAQADAQAYQDQQYQQQQYQQQQYQQPVYAAPPPAAAPQAADSDDLIEQLQKLGALRDQGILTDAEFDAQKAKLLGG
ncbi:MULTISPECIES: SHOCT domain-containing protein [unclassified Nocardioides]|uniref:SHOCT domain-containing protein n=1 Tax=unclassified Nocardioides TaxID=2615069 RepID=UPI003620484A